jgi:plasmid stabilization system protein ParE
MLYNYRLSEEAEMDVEMAYLWYEQKEKGLGDSFLKVLDLAKNAIISDPTTYSFRYKKKVRGFVLRRFPYLILYVINIDNVDVIAVFNTYQNPKKWKGRV